MFWGPLEDLKGTYDAFIGGADGGGGVVEGEPIAEMAAAAAPGAEPDAELEPHDDDMGKGKGDVDRWVAAVKPGTVLFELGGITEEKAKLAFKRVAHKMPVKVKMVRRLPTT